MAKRETVTIGGTSWGPGRIRSDFYKQGQVSARMGNTRSIGNEYRMPVFGCSASWQGKAFARGFRDECKALGQVCIETGTP